jgi:hypothetical protein
VTFCDLPVCGGKPLQKSVGLVKIFYHNFFNGLSFLIEKNNTILNYFRENLPNFSKRIVNWWCIYASLKTHILLGEQNLSEASAIFIFDGHTHWPSSSASASHIDHLKNTSQEFLSLQAFGKPIKDLLRIMLC